MSFLSSSLFRAVLTAACLMSGPATVGALTDPAAPAAVPVPVADDPPFVEPTPPASAPGLDAEQVYAILVGETARRRGAMTIAFVHYLKAAQLTQSAQLAELAVRAALAADDREAAEQGVRLWLALAPDMPAVHQVAAVLRIKADDREGALIHLARLVELTEGAHESVYAEAASVIARASRPETRLELMQALVGQFPESADAQQSLALVAASAAQFEIASAAARRALELRPDWNPPRLFLVRLLLSESKRAEARALLEDFVAQRPDDQSLRMLYGQFLIEEKEFVKAREVFEQLLSNQPKAADALFAVGILSLQLDDPNGARLYFMRLYETGERQDDAAFYLGQTAERAKDARTALEWYEKVEGSNFAEAQVRIAFLRATAGEVAAAREIFNRLRDATPDDAVALFLIEAEILDEIGRSDEAMTVFNAALEIHREDKSLLYARALHAVDREQLQLAEQDLRRIIAADPKHVDALNALGYTLADRTDRYQEARGYIEQAYALKPDEPAILDSMGWINYRLGHYEVARDYLQRALDKMNDGEIAAHLGEVLWAMERQADAWAIWEAALIANPEHAYLRKIVERHRSLNQETDAREAHRTLTPGGRAP